MQVLYPSVEVWDGRRKIVWSPRYTMHCRELVLPIFRTENAGRVLDHKDNIQEEEY